MPASRRRPTGGRDYGDFSCRRRSRPIGVAQSSSQCLPGARGELFQRQADVEFVRYVYRPPSGLGANLEIEFRLSTEDGTSRTRDLQTVPVGRGRTEYDDARYSSGESVGKYDPLRRFLSEVDGSEWAATFDQVEQVLGFRLPASARKWRPWWANVENGPSQTRAWAAAGWKTRHVSLLEETLVFVRTGPTFSERGEIDSGAVVPTTKDLEIACLLDRTFVHAAPIEPERGPDGALLGFTPQSRFAHAATMRLNRFGSGPFCRFELKGLPRTPGVYVVTIDNAPTYVGMAVDLAKRWGPGGYANISPRPAMRTGSPRTARSISTSCGLQAKAARSTSGSMRTRTPRRSRQG